jgi:hypothetical protein
MFLRIASFGFSLMSALVFAIWLVPRTKPDVVSDKAWSFGQVNRTYEAMQLIEITALVAILCVIAQLFRYGWKQTRSHKLTWWAVVLLLPVVFVEGLRIYDALTP